MRTFFWFQEAVQAFVLADVRLHPNVQRKFGFTVAQPSAPELHDAFRRCSSKDRAELVSAVIHPEPVAPGCGVFHTRRAAFAG